MRDLSPEALALLRAGRTAFRPDASDRDRVLLSLASALGDRALLDPPGGSGPAGGAPWSRFPVRTGAIVGRAAALAIGGAALVASASHPWTGTAARSPAPVASVPALGPLAPGPSPAPSAPRSIEFGPATSGTGSVPAPPPGTVASDPSPAPLARPWSASRPAHPSPRPAERAASDALAEEVRLLSRAERLLNDGLAPDALALLGEHERRFPKGVLAEERMAAQVEALCALGRTADARSERARLAATFPRSAHLQGASRSCADEGTP
ncbi:MAG: hypothetical protein JOZ69_13265 [Myxococcales bacterium]|nr:hypothetical protein [Myxococcales bacterium]